MACGAQITLYETLTYTSPVFEVDLTTTTIYPYQTAGPATERGCRAWVGTACFWTTTETEIVTIDFQGTKTVTEGSVARVPSTGVTIIPTATVEALCNSSDDEEVNNVNNIYTPLTSEPESIPAQVEKRGEGRRSMRMEKKGGLVILCFFLAYMSLPFALI